MAKMITVCLHLELVQQQRHVKGHDRHDRLTPGSVFCVESNMLPYFRCFMSFLSHRLQEFKRPPAPKQTKKALELVRRSVLCIDDIDPAAICSFFTYLWILTSKRYHHKRFEMRATTMHECRPDYTIFLQQTYTISSPP